MNRLIQFPVYYGFLMLLILAKQSDAQTYKLHPLLSPMWQLDADYFAPSQVQGSTFEHGFSGGSAQIRLPLYTGKDWISADGYKPFYAVMLHLAMSYRQTQGYYLEPDRNIYTPRVGLTALASTGKKNLFLLQFGTALPSEEFLFKPSYINYNGTGVWRHLYRQGFWHTLGLTYTPLFGKNQILPVFGAGYNFSKRDQVQFTFPFNAAYSHKFSEAFSLSFRYIRSGGYAYLKEDDRNPVDPLVFREWFGRYSLQARWYSYRHLILMPEVGITSKARLELNDNKNGQLSSLYIRLVMQVRFGNRPPVAPILDFDPGDSGFDPGYLNE